ncbi:UDP-N-acetylmuramoyl-L-alanyl-D-glutamate--2,6-diaminopimelate ligase [Myxococcota bacterium]|nr:UDP-N-acetylmuramoyl-L-alanyl-D-glutamate--2,6-diaminopimelate ligase [Myxococcota bacterium]
MRLSEVISVAADAQEERPALHGGESDTNPLIRGIAYDSRSVTAGDLFFAIRGSLDDGHDHLDQAIELGAVALVVEQLPEGLDLRGRPALIVPDSRRALAPVSTRFFGHPSRELKLVGVTGTNGKTSVTYLLESILNHAGIPTGLVGTVEVRFQDERRRSLNTTPESFDLQSALRSMRTRGADAVVMEVSSHGLELGRVEGCEFRVGAFTNLTQDHLDFHDSMETYRAAKARLFNTYLGPDSNAVINADDPSAPEMIAAAEHVGARIVRVSRNAETEAEVRLTEAVTHLDGTRARLTLGSEPIDISLPLLGDFNVENMLVACGVAFALGIPAQTIAVGTERCPQVPGRVERIGADLPGAPTVLVDYAHTPDAVEKVARTLRLVTPGRLIVVFGCGGDRDRSKRPLMARAVVDHADRIIATSDNPRTEDPERILEDVEAGLIDLERVSPERLEDTQGAYCSLVDRRSAIELAIRIAHEGDTILIAGKGHEDYQIVGRDRLPFSDCDEARRALENRGGT